MLKTVLFFLFGCSLYFAQTTAGSSATLEGDGTKVKTSSGEGSGSGNSFPNLTVVQDGSSLRLFLTRAEAKFNNYSIYNTTGMAITENQNIRPTNSYSLDVSTMKPGHYYISVEVVTPANISITQQFIKL